MRPAESFVGQPVRSLQTMLRVLAEDDSRLPTIVPDGIYGPSTMHAVSAFQRQNGLPVTGIADQTTWDALVNIYEQAIIRIEKAQYIEILLEPGEILRYGDSSPYVFLLQSMLTQLSIYHPTIQSPSHSGMIDESTQSALRSFQALSGLPETGEADRLTWKNVVHQFTLSAHHNRNRSY